MAPIAFERSTIAAATPSVCMTGATLSKARAYAAAASLYEQELKQRPWETCAQEGYSGVEGIRKQASADYQVGQQLATGKKPQPAKARTWFVKALNTDPTNTEASIALNKLVSPHPKAKPKGTQTGLRDYINDFFVGAESFMLWLGKAVPFIVLIFAIPPLALGCAWRLRPAVRRWWGQPTVDIEAFADGATGLTLGSALAGQVQQFFLEFDRFGVIPAPTLVIGTIQNAADVLSSIPQLSVLDAVSKFALPQRQFKLTGTLLPEGKQGAGVSLSIEDNWNATIVACYTLWATDTSAPDLLPPQTQPATAQNKGTGGSDPPKADPQSYLDLAETIAIWAQYQLGLYWASTEA
jgi:hypothetical protein